MLGQREMDVSDPEFSGPHHLNVANGVVETSTEGALDVEEHEGLRWLSRRSLTVRRRAVEERSCPSEREIGRSHGGTARARRFGLATGSEELTSNQHDAKQ